MEVQGRPRRSWAGSQGGGGNAQGFGSLIRRHGWEWRVTERSALSTLPRARLRSARPRKQMFPAAVVPCRRLQLVPILEFRRRPPSRLPDCVQSRLRALRRCRRRPFGSTTCLQKLRCHLGQRGWPSHPPTFSSTRVGFLFRLAFSPAPYTLCAPKSRPSGSGSSFSSACRLALAPRVPPWTLDPLPGHAPGP